MRIENVGNFTYHDAIADDEIYVAVRVSDEAKAAFLCISMKSNGDVDVALNAENCEKIIRMLQESMKKI